MLGWWVRRVVGRLVAGWVAIVSGVGSVPTYTPHPCNLSPTATATATATTKEDFIG